MWRREKSEGRIQEKEFLVEAEKEENTGSHVAFPQRGEGLGFTHGNVVMALVSHHTRAKINEEFSIIRCLNRDLMYGYNKIDV